MSTNQQQALSANINLSTPLISMEQFMQYKVRQDEIEKNRLNETMSNIIQTFLPGCNFDFNSLANLTTPSSKSSSLPSNTKTTPPFVARTESATRRSLPTAKKGVSNISKQLPWVVILELRCIEPKVNGTCNEKVATEEDLQLHLQAKHGILKYRCLSMCCIRSFDRRKYREVHVGEAHSKGLVCRHCPKKVKTSHGIEEHYKVYHQKGLYQCMHCSAVKEYLGEMRKHTKVCTKSRANNFVEPPRTLRSAVASSSTYPPNVSLQLSN